MNSSIGNNGIHLLFTIYLTFYHTPHAVRCLKYELCYDVLCFTHENNY